MREMRYVPDFRVEGHWADMVSQMAHAALKGSPHE